MGKTFSQHKVRASIVVCSLNGEARIKSCLHSIFAQTYPVENYEVIVVDDGSVDNTSDIARLSGARIVRFEKNRGIPSARNAGISASNGEIVVFIDDDCIAEQDWLDIMMRMFEDNDTVAVGGKILAYAKETISEQYMEAVGYGNPPRPPSGKIQGNVGKLWSYFSNMYSPIMFATAPLQVDAVYTANAAYRKSALDLLGGFDESLRTSEDSDISERMRRSGWRIMYTPKAIVRHRHYKSLFKVIREPFLRARYALKLYLKERRIPPIFPLPVIWVSCLIVCMTFLSSYFFTFFIGMVLLPVVLYGWWAVRMLKEHKLVYMAFPYIQLIVESAAILGLLMGLTRVLFTRVPVVELGNKLDKKI